MPAFTWMWWLLGAALIGGGSVLLFWALIGRRLAWSDRRRCPRCRYDLSATPGLTCSECGHTYKDERALRRPPRARWMVVLGMLVLVMGFVSPVVPLVRTGNYTFLPTSWLIELWGVRPTPYVFDSLLRARVYEQSQADRFHLARVCRGYLHGPFAYGNSPASYSLILLGWLGGDAAPAFDGIDEMMAASSPAQRDIFIYGTPDKLLAAYMEDDPRRVRALLAGTPSHADKVCKIVGESFTLGPRMVHEWLNSGDTEMMLHGIETIASKQNDDFAEEYPRLIALFGDRTQVLWTEARNALERLGPAADPLIGEAMLAAPCEITRDYITLLRRRGPHGEGALPHLKLLAETEEFPYELRRDAADAFRDIASNKGSLIDPPRRPWRIPLARDR